MFVHILTPTCMVMKRACAHFADVVWIPVVGFLFVFVISSVRNSLRNHAPLLIWHPLLEFSLSTTPQCYNNCSKLLQHATGNSEQFVQHTHQEIKAPPPQKKFNNSTLQSSGGAYPCLRATLFTIQHIARRVQCVPCEFPFSRFTYFQFNSFNSSTRWLVQSVAKI